MLHEDYSEERFRYAAALVEESLEINQALDNKVGIAKAFNVLGEIRHELAEYPQAQRLIEDGLSLARLIGSRGEEGVALGYLGAWALDLGDYPRAITCLRECLAALDLSDVSRTVEILEVYTLTAVAEDQVGVKHGTTLVAERGDSSRAQDQESELAIGLLGAAEELRAKQAAPRVRKQQRRMDRTLPALRAELGGTTFEAWLAQGRSWSIEDARAAILP